MIGSGIGAILGTKWMILRRVFGMQFPKKLKNQCRAT
jgi:hypothetical protein